MIQMYLKDQTVLKKLQIWILNFELQAQTFKNFSVV
jgi:hypothetical protein